MDADSADETRFTRAPTRGLTANQCGVRIEGAAATRTSEVGSHRVTEGEEPTADWTDPLKRGRRRENAGSSGRFGKALCLKAEGTPGREIIGRKLVIGT